MLTKKTHRQLSRMQVNTVVNGVYEALKRTSQSTNNAQNIANQVIWYIVHIQMEQNGMDFRMALRFTLPSVQRGSWTRPKGYRNQKYL